MTQPTATATGHRTWHHVAPATIEGNDIAARLDDSKTGTDLAQAVNRIPGGLRAGDLLAVWEIRQPGRPNPADADGHARTHRPTRLMIVTASGELLRLDGSYRLDVITP